MSGIAGYAGAMVNPALALAIESTRQHLRELVPEGPGTIDGLAALAPIDGADLRVWQPDSRAGVLAFEAFAGLVFEPSEHGGELRAWGMRKDGAEPVTLATITRPGLDVLADQAKRVALRMPERLMPKSDHAPERERLAEIGAQVVPPLAFWCAVLPLHPQRMPRTMELIDLTLQLASCAVQRFKHALAVPRPNQMDACIHPAILTPAHGSLPSGHATEAYAVAEVLRSLLGLAENSVLARRMSALAARIADNREVAGLHYPIDTQAGRLLGGVLARYLVARCTEGTCRSAAFEGHAMKLQDDLAPSDVGEGPAIRLSPPLKSHWDNAAKEWGIGA